MSPLLQLYGATVQDHRTTADLTAEHAARSAEINRVHPVYNGTIEPYDPTAPDRLAERIAVQNRLDSYKSPILEPAA